MITQSDYDLEDAMWIPRPTDLTRGRQSLPTSNWGHQPFTRQQLDKIAPLSDEQLAAICRNDVSPEIDAQFRKRIAAARRLGNKHAQDQTIDLT